MSVLVEEVFSDFNIELLEFGIKPTSIPDQRKIRLLNEGIRIFAEMGKAFDYEISINIKEDVNTYDLPDNYYSLIKVRYNGDRLFKRPLDIKTANSVKYYDDIVDNKIVLIGTPGEDGDGYLVVRYFGYSAISITSTDDEIELLSKHSQYQQALVFYLLFRVLQNKPEFANNAGYYGSYFNTKVNQCAGNQLAKVKQGDTIRLGY